MTSFPRQSTWLANPSTGRIRPSTTAQEHTEPCLLLRAVFFFFLSFFFWTNVFHLRSGENGVGGVNGLP